MFKWDALNYKEIISKDVLFWGDKRLLDIVGKENQYKFCSMELYEWISGLYWGEGVAVKYASKMMELATTEESKKDWMQVYREEFKHQTIVGKWLLDRDLEPLPMNSLLKYCLDLIESLSPDMDNKEVINVIESTQLYFEELIHFFVKTRLNKVIDRDLQAILYLILKEEAVHISKGRKEIQLRDGFPPLRAVLLKENINKIFPKFFCKDYLSDEQYNSVKSISTEIATDFIERGLKNDTVYSPIPIIKEFLKIPGFNCSATSPTRGDSMHIYPKSTGEYVYDELVFPKRYEGFNRFVHGGSSTMALDEIMIYSVLHKFNLISVTAQLNVKFLAPIYIDKAYRLEARVIDSKDNMFNVEGLIIDIKTEKVCAKANGDFFVPTHEHAQKMFGKMADSAALKDRFYIS